MGSAELIYMMADVNHSLHVKKSDSFLSFRHMRFTNEKMVILLL